MDRPVRHRSNPTKSPYPNGSRHSLQQPTSEQLLLDRYLQEKYGINREDQHFQRHNDLVNSKQVYEMLDAAHQCDNKQTRNFTFKKNFTTRDSSDNERPRETVSKTPNSNTQLLKRLEKAQKQIDTQKRRVHQLQSRLKNGHMKQDDKENHINAQNVQNERKSHSIHTRFVQRVRQMMESIEGSSQTNNLQQLWRWLKVEMQNNQQSKLMSKRLQALIRDKQLVRAEEVARIICGKRD